MRIRRCQIMGILNVTPDSFFDGGKFRRLDAAAAQGDAMAAEGADIFDVGGESTRPGSMPVATEEEIRRVVPVVRALKRRHSKIPVSIDTQKSEVAERALDEGAEIVNDISALRADPLMADLVRRKKAGVVLMHMLGNPVTMQRAPHYRNAPHEIRNFLGERIRFAVKKGIPREKIWIDPGIGFGKTVDHNLDLLAQLKELEPLGAPVLIGASRKSFLGKILGGLESPLPPEARLSGSLAAAGWSWLQGASILRVHDVAETRNLVRVLEQILKIRHT